MQEFGVVVVVVVAGVGVVAADDAVVPVVVVVVVVVGCSLAVATGCMGGWVGTWVGRSSRCPGMCLFAHVVVGEVGSDGVAAGFVVEVGRVRVVGSGRRTGFAVPRGSSWTRSRGRFCFRPCGKKMADRVSVSIVFSRIFM